MANIFSKIRDWIKSLFFWKKSKKAKTVSMVMPQIHSGVTVIDTGKEIHETDLVPDDIGTHDKKKLRQFTKIVVVILIIASIIWITWSYVLASIALLRDHNFSPLETISTTVCNVILGTVGAYMAKSFIETFSEKKNEIKMMEMEKQETPQQTESGGLENG